MRNVDKEKWYVLYTKTAEEKAAWMSAFQKERVRVTEDEKTGVFFKTSILLVYADF